MAIKQIDSEPVTSAEDNLVSGLFHSELETEPTTANDHDDGKRGRGDGVSGKELLVASRRRELAIARAHSTVIEDLRFLDAWEKGLVPNLSGFLRARQILRGNRSVEPSGTSL
jgi:hypothetical protein